MKNALKALIMLGLIMSLTGCWYSIPDHNKQIDAGVMSLNSFTIVSEEGSDFQWKYDGSPVSGNTYGPFNVYLHFFKFGDADSAHTVTVNFKEDGDPQSVTWNIKVRNILGD